MGKITTLRDLIGIIKDKASQSKAALLSVSTKSTFSFHLAVLRVTNHSHASPPADHHLSALLSLGHSSRSTASAVVDSLMDRLHSTGDSSVALKCLLAIHHIVKRGPFILQDQLSNFPATGGRNYLKLSSFRDGATTTTWALSAWVRWYARYLETLLSSFRVLGFSFLSSFSCSTEKVKKEDRVLSISNQELIRDVDSLVGVIEEICKLPDSILFEGNKLLYEIKVLVGSDYLTMVNETLPRLTEFKERLSSLSFAEYIELMCALKRIQDCKERLLELFTIKKPSTVMLWDLTEELKNKAEMVNGYKTGRLLLTLGGGGRGRDSESARFGDRVLTSGDLVRFSSGRFGLNPTLSLVVSQ